MMPVNCSNGKRNWEVRFLDKTRKIRDKNEEAKRGKGVNPFNSQGRFIIRP
jgi:hypothetical protein